MLSLPVLPLYVRIAKREKLRHRLDIGLHARASEDDNCIHHHFIRCSCFVESKLYVPYGGWMLKSLYHICASVRSNEVGLEQGGTRRYYAEE
jgi:hypothetical protein